MNAVGFWPVFGGLLCWSLVTLRIMCSTLLLLIDVNSCHALNTSLASCEQYRSILGFKLQFRTHQGLKTLKISVLQHFFYHKAKFLRNTTWVTGFVLDTHGLFTLGG